MAACRARVGALEEPYLRRWAPRGNSVYSDRRSLPHANCHASTDAGHRAGGALTPQNEIPPGRAGSKWCQFLAETTPKSLAQILSQHKANQAALTRMAAIFARLMPLRFAKRDPGQPSAFGSNFSPLRFTRSGLSCSIIDEVERGADLRVV